MSVQPWYSIHRRQLASAQSTTTVPHAEIWIYGDIGESWYGDSVAAKDFVQTVAALDAETITVRLNSCGGSVSDGIAASIASLIAMAVDRIEIAENAMLMIRAPWGSMASNAVDHWRSRLHTWRWQQLRPAWQGSPARGFEARGCWSYAPRHSRRRPT